MINQTKFKSIHDLVLAFPDERSCHQYLGGQRWEYGVVECPHCEHDCAYVFKDGIRYKCTKCRKIYTAKTGTFMGGSKLPTIKWFIAMYLIMHKKGISYTQLAKDINVTQKTAWFVLHRLRYALGH
jgi:transposase-like protein